MCGTQLNRRWFSFALTAKDTSDFVKETLLLNRCDSKFSALILYNSVELRFQLRNVLRSFNGVCDIPSTMSFEITNQLIKSKIAIFILPIPKEIEAVNNNSYLVFSAKLNNVWNTGRSKSTVAHSICLIVI